MSHTLIPTLINSPHHPRGSLRYHQLNERRYHFIPDQHTKAANHTCGNTEGSLPSPPGERLCTYLSGRTANGHAPHRDFMLSSSNPQIGLKRRIAEEGWGPRMSRLTAAVCGLFAPLVPLSAPPSEPRRCKDSRSSVKADSRARRRLRSFSLAAVAATLEAVLAAVGVQCRFHREEGVDDTLLPSTTTSGAGTHAQAYTQPQHQDAYLDPRP